MQFFSVLARMVLCMIYIFLEHRTIRNVRRQNKAVVKMSDRSGYLGTLNK